MSTPGKRKAVVLLSGGLDSTTTLAIAKSDGCDCYALTVAYGQLHRVELEAAQKVAKSIGATEHRVLTLDLASLAVSALTSPELAVPKDRSLEEIATEGSVPPTYVPARNTVLLSLALAWAESVGADAIYLGVNVLDASGYPDCRAEFVTAFQALVNVATRSGIEGGSAIRVQAPLISWTKAEIILVGQRLGVDYSMTHSCYDPGSDNGACGRCDACVLRAKGFRDAGVADPTRYSAG